MKTIYKISFLVVFSLLSLAIFAQNNEVKKDSTKTSLNESVIIVTQFEPTINEAYKIAESPNIFDTTFPVPSLNYEVINKVFPTKLNVEPINPAKVKGEPIAMLYNGNLKVGLGTYLTPYLDFNYSEKRNRTLLYSTQIRNYSSFWTIKDSPTSHFSNTDINLYGKKIWDKFYVDAKLYYNNALNYYYGFNNDSLKLDSKDYRMIWNNVGFRTNYASLYRNDDALHHNIGFLVENLSARYGLNELNVGIYADANKKFKLFGQDKQTIGLKFNYKHTFDKFDQPGFDTYNTGIVSIKPYFDFKVKKFELHTALDFSPEFGKESKFHLIPTAVVDFPIIPSQLNFKGGIIGGVERISLNSLRIENPYIAPYLDLKTTSNINLFAALKSNFVDNLDINLELGMQYLKNQQFYSFDTVASYKNMFSITYDNASRLYIKANMGYSIDKTFKVIADLEYQTYNVESLDFAYYKPSFMASMSLQYIAADKLTIYFTPTFKTKTRAMYFNEEVSLKPIIDLNLSAEYEYSDQTRFFVRLNNLAFQSYESYYNYPSQRFMGMIGVSISF